MNTTSDFKIPRLKPRNDVVGQSPVSPLQRGEPVLDFPLLKRGIKGDFSGRSTSTDGRPIGLLFCGVE